MKKSFLYNKDIKGKANINNKTYITKEEKLMLNIIFMILMFIVFGRILKFAIKAAWGMSKMICSIVLLPLFLICLVFKGLVEIAFPILVIVGIISIFSARNTN